MIYAYKEAKPSPKNEIGFIGWVRKNLFSTYLNTFLTLLGIYILYLALPPILNWFIFDATWSGSKEEITKDGARWIFIYEKFNQFMYGFYPEDQYWRVNLVYILFIVGIFVLRLEVLKKRLPIKIALLVAYPIISFILIYGGFGLEVIPTDKWGGLLATLVIASVGIVVAFPFGIIFALGRQSQMPIIRTLCVGYIEFIRGVPLITLLFMASVILPLFFPEGVNFDKLLRALIGITMFQSVYIAEVVRGGLQGLPKGQYEAADSLGLSYWQSMLLIILPQALKISIPNLVGASISLFKDTTLVLIIGIFDILAMVHFTSSDTNWLGFELEGYVFVGIIYWMFCYSMSFYSKQLEKKYNYKI